jgi:hypothetical protein
MAYSPFTKHSLEGIHGMLGGMSSCRILLEMFIEFFALLISQSCLCLKYDTINLLTLGAHHCLHHGVEIHD